MYHVTQRCRRGRDVIAIMESGQGYGEAEASRTGARQARQRRPGQRDLAVPDAGADDHVRGGDHPRVHQDRPLLRQPDRGDAAVLHAGQLDRVGHRREARLADVQRPGGPHRSRRPGWWRARCRPRSGPRPRACRPPPRSWPTRRAPPRTRRRRRPCRRGRRRSARPARRRRPPARRPATARARRRPAGPAGLGCPWPRLWRACRMHVIVPRVRPRAGVVWTEASRQAPNERANQQAQRRGKTAAPTGPRPARAEASARIIASCGWGQLGQGPGRSRQHREVGLQQGQQRLGCRRGSVRPSGRGAGPSRPALPGTHR